VGLPQFCVKGRPTGLWLGKRKAESGEASLLPSIPRPEGRGQAHLADTPEALQRLVDQLGRQQRISVDLETTHVWPRWAEIVGCSVAWKEDEAWYVPVRAPAGEPCLDPRQTLDALRPILENSAIEKVGQNLKYDMIVLRSAGVALAGAAFDTMVASYLLEAGARNHSLDDLAKRYLGRGKTPISELIGTGKAQRRMDEVPVRRVADYACDDAMLPLRLRPLLARELAAAGLESLFHELEMPLVEVLVELESNGIRVDCDRLAGLSRRFGEQIQQLEREIHGLAGRPFNIASPKQLQQVLFEEQKLPVVSRTKTGPSTDADVLEELARVHPLPAKILEYRQYAKLKSTYVDALPEMVHPQTGRVHASFHQEVAATGRLSSSDPNLQNIPVRTEAGREIRSAFIPGEPGWLLLAADYSQIELRIMAHLSGDKAMIKAFNSDQDIHAATAANIYHIPLEEVTSDMRRKAKTANFGIIYGISVFGLAERMGVSRTEAKTLIDGYFETYPAVKAYMDRVINEAKVNGWVETLYHRKRYLPDITSNNAVVRGYAERNAINAPIQGTAADIIKIAMVRIQAALQRENLRSNMILQVHDELNFIVPKDELEPLMMLVRREMEAAADLHVPLKADIGYGSNWLEAH